MNDAEAEVGLQALSEPLVWQDAATKGAFDASDGKNFYHVWFLSSEQAFCALLLTEGQDPMDSRDVGTVEEMKAVCERHHQTGEWD